MLQRADRAMVAELRKRLDRFGATGATAATKVKSLNKLIDAVVAGRRAVWLELQIQINKEFRDIGATEAAVSNDLLTKAVGIEEFSPDLVAAGAVGVAVQANVYQGRTTPQHLKDLELREREIIAKSVRQGVFDGLRAGAIVTGLQGSRGFGMTDGALNSSRNALGALVSTGVNAATTMGREVQYRDTGVITGVVWTAILDGRTTPICQSRDGFGVPYTDDFPKDIPLLQPPGARPPAHFNCRSYMEAVLRDVGVVKPHRVFVTDTRTNRKRVIDFRKQAKADSPNWSALTERQRRRRIRAVANQWAADNIGTVSAQTNYPEFLARQSAKFQDSVLGPTRGLLFRRGDLPVTAFVDQTGKTFTLEQLQAAHPGAFRKAGFGPPATPPGS
ncbi:MAG: hypothetical protein KAU28_10470, partial [Phycisphaerae bacterium]|nr:hypothetical protein [Phycisphaerae bacterium]